MIHLLTGYRDPPTRHISIYTKAFYLKVPFTFNDSCLKDYLETARRPIEESSKMHHRQEAEGVDMLRMGTF
jgi:hypothetical protein